MEDRGEWGLVRTRFAILKLKRNSAAMYLHRFEDHRERYLMPSIRCSGVFHYFVAVMATLAVGGFSSSASAATVNWDGGAAGTGTAFDTAANWVGDINPSVSAGDTAQFNGTTGLYTGGALSLSYAGNFAGAAGNP